MEENLQEDWLDAQLRDESPYIDDAGFTSKVVQKLPTRTVRHRTRAAILIGLTLLASVVVYFSGVFWFVAEMFARFALLPLPVIWLSAAVATGLVMAGGVAAVISKPGGRSR
jgi:hypothetical protein